MWGKCEYARFIPVANHEARPSQLFKVPEWNEDDDRWQANGLLILGADHKSGKSAKKALAADNIDNDNFRTWEDVRAAVEQAVYESQA